MWVSTRTNLDRLVRSSGALAKNYLHCICEYIGILPFNLSQEQAQMPACFSFAETFDVTMNWLTILC